MNQLSSTDTSLSSSLRPSADTISRRAYELWEQEGRPEGNDLRHWLQAEQELLGQNGSNGATFPETGRSQPEQSRESPSDVRPLQGTRASAAVNREGKRSRSPFSSDKSTTSNATGAKPELAASGRRRS